MLINSLEKQQNKGLQGDSLQNVRNANCFKVFFSWLKSD